MADDRQPTMALYERFWDKIDVRGPDECWPWTASTCCPGGPGHFRVGSGVHLAPRLIWQWFVGPIPAGLCVLHTCDFPRCCNPRHHWLGTRADNNADKVAKGRQARGRAVKRSNLADSDVLEIYSRKGRELIAGLAARFGVAESTVRNIHHGMSWSHLTGSARRSPGHRRGEGSNFAKLSEKSAREIFYDRGHLSPPVCAGLYGVSSSTVRDIRARRTWRHATRDVDGVASRR